MAKFVRLQRDDAADAAAQVSAGLDHGLAVVPVLGGYCVLAAGPDELRRRFGAAYRLVASAGAVGQELTGLDSHYAAGVLRALAGPVVGVLNETSAPGGVAVATELLLAAVVKRRADAWLGVPDEPMEPGELADELGNAAAVVMTRESFSGPGPTVVDFTRRPAVVDRHGKLAILDLERELGELVRLGQGVSFSVLVVCTGNSCRSPMAAGVLARFLAGERAFVYSAGTDAPVGNPATMSALETARAVGVDLSRHRAKQLTREMVEAADLILAMDHYHRERIAALVPDAAGRTRLLLEFAGRADAEVEDPIGHSLEFYRRTLDVMMPALEKVATDVRTRLGR